MVPGWLATSHSLDGLTEILSYNHDGSVAPDSLAIAGVTRTHSDPFFRSRFLEFSLGAIRNDSVEYFPPFEGYDPHVSNVQWDRALIVGGALTMTVTAIHIYQQNAWWRDQRTSFHFVDDGDYALNVDKAGHFLGGAFGAFLGRKSLEWSGVSQEVSVLGGSAMGALFELYVEFEDGFARDWGFSRGDAYADLIGAVWPVAQYYVKPVASLQPKFTYFPSTKFLNGTHQGNAIDDYEGQTYWLGVHLHGLLPQTLKSYWPSWLGLAFGVSIRNMPTREELLIDPRKSPVRSLILALDYDFTQILPMNSWWWRTLAEALNFVHFPSPAIRISPNYIAYGLYF